ncbi:hypothetical protein D3C79_853580 [compost metagenome]
MQLQPLHGGKSNYSNDQCLPDPDGFCRTFSHLNRKHSHHNGDYRLHKQSHAFYDRRLLIFLHNLKQDDQCSGRGEDGSKQRNNDSNPAKDIIADVSGDFRGNRTGQGIAKRQHIRKLLVGEPAVMRDNFLVHQRNGGGAAAITQQISHEKSKNQF